MGIADPRDFARKKLQACHKVADQNTFNGMSSFVSHLFVTIKVLHVFLFEEHLFAFCIDWRCIAEREKFADAVLICTPDRLHKVCVWSMFTVFFFFFLDQHGVLSKFLLVNE